MKNVPFVQGLSVWVVTEYVDHVTKEGTSIKQETYVLASCAVEALEIVGADERRKVIAVQEICPLSQLPSDKYRPVLVTQHVAEMARRR